MIELRKAGKEEALGDVKSAKSANSGDAFSKLQQTLVIGNQGKLSDKVYIYYITHLLVINH
jgi:hypothetical protein